MRQEHRAGEKLFVDFAGQTIPITDPRTGEITAAQLFVAVLGASSYTYAEALPSQELPHWIAAHVATFAFLGGCTRLIVPDNLKAGVTRAHRYEPDINPTYAEMAAHYGAAVILARPRKPPGSAASSGSSSPPAMTRAMPGRRSCAGSSSRTTSGRTAGATSVRSRWLRSTPSPWQRR
jgi:transposase